MHLNNSVEDSIWNLYLYNILHQYILNYTYKVTLLNFKTTMDKFCVVYTLKAIGKSNQKCLTLVYHRNYEF